MIIGNKEFGNHTYVMGILNVTPDSFSDGGKFNNIDSALKHTEQLINDGADIIDVGGESTRPNYTKISDEEEIERVVPVIEKIKADFDVPVSIDTYKSKVAAAAVGAGADLVNDIWGLKYDKNMAEVIAKSGAACCLMHNRERAEYNSFVEDVLDDLRETIAIAKKAGIADIRRTGYSMEGAIMLARSIAKAPQAVLLSPACSSFDMYDNFEQRGRVFKGIVNAI